MAIASQDQVQELTNLCTGLSPEAVARILVFARDEASCALDAGARPAEVALTDEEERQRRIEGMEEFLALAAEIGAQMPRGGSIVQTLSELRDEREAALSGLGRL